MKMIGQFNYKIQFNLEERKKDFEKAMKNCTNKIPVIIERGYNSTLKQIKKTKYLLPSDLKIGELMRLIHNKLELNYKTAIFLLVASKFAITGSELLSEIYKKYKDKDDKFLYISYIEQQTFG